MTRALSGATYDVTFALMPLYKIDMFKRVTRSRCFYVNCPVDESSKLEQDENRENHV